MKGKKVVVVLPIYKTDFTPAEILSLQTLRKKLSGKYDICVISHVGLRTPILKEKLLKGYRTKYFSKDFFTYQGYNLLLKEPLFYSSFKEYNYMLIYQTDCLVFQNDLGYWMDKDLDYVGSPWFLKNKSGNPDFVAVGNGGLSLRKISSFIEVSRKAKKGHIKFLIFVKNLFPSIPVLFHKIFISRDYPRYHIGCRNEDIFYSYVSKQILPPFKISDYRDSLRFSFEKYPTHCYNENLKKSPFGCHAFNKYEPSFWKKFT